MFGQMHFWNFQPNYYFFMFGNLVRIAKDLNIRNNISILAVRVNILEDWIQPSSNSYVTLFQQVKRKVWLKLTKFHR